MYKKLIAPLIILALLISAMALRYNVEASTTIGKTVIKWERDRWTGEIWIQKYWFNYHEGTQTAILAGDNVTDKEKQAALDAALTLSIIWWGLVVADLLWLTIIYLCARRKKEPESRVCG